MAATSPRVQGFKGDLERGNDTWGLERSEAAQPSWTEVENPSSTVTMGKVTPEGTALSQGVHGAAPGSCGSPCC